MKGNDYSHSTQIIQEDRSENTSKLILWDDQYNYSKSGKELTKKGNYRSIFLMNIDANILTQWE